MDLIARMVHNATSWDYPMELHMQLCAELRICPEVYIVPGWMKKLFIDHFNLNDYADTEAFSDETGNVVYFFEEYWTEEYRKWLIHHEMYHQQQYYDKGNYRGDRWLDLSEKQRQKEWEREADEFADTRVGKLEKVIKRYCREPDNLLVQPFVNRYLEDMQHNSGAPRLLIRGRRR